MAPYQLLLHVITKSGSLKKLEAGITVYCLDISGSMEDQRMDAVKSTILKQIKHLKDVDENHRVAVVTFGSNANILGDGTSEPMSTNSCDFNRLKKKADNYPQIKPLRESHEKLEQAISKIKPLGCTALGSGLALAVLLAKRHHGQVILCTDGMTNRGLHINQENLKMVKLLFLHFLFLIVKPILMPSKKIMTTTSGRIHQINFDDMEEKMNITVYRKQLGSDCTAKVFAHPSLSTTKNYEIGSLQEEKKPFLFKFDIANARELSRQNTVSVQVQMTYKRLDNAECLSIFDLDIGIIDEVSSTNVKVLVQGSLQEISRLALEGKYDESLKRLENLSQIVGAKDDLDQTVSNNLNDIIPTIKELIEEARNNGEGSDEFAAVMSGLFTAQEGAIIS
ncbi:VWFA domain-containing protein [Entamoeba marina]